MPPENPDRIAAALGLTPEAARATDERHRDYLQGKDLQSPETQAKWAKALEENQKNPYYKPLVIGQTPPPKRVSRRAKEPGGRDYTEKDFQTDFNKWAIKNLTKSCALELKVSPTDSLPFDRLEDHQKKNLLKAKQQDSTGFIYKIPDDSTHSAQRPFDGVFLKNACGWVVIQFNCKDRGQREFFLIDIEKWCEEELLSGRKSLTSSRAKEIGYVQRL